MAKPLLKSRGFVVYDRTENAVVGSSGGVHPTKADAELALERELRVQSRSGVALHSYVIVSSIEGGS